MIDQFAAAVDDHYSKRVDPVCVAQTPFEGTTTYALQTSSQMSSLAAKVPDRPWLADRRMTVTRGYG